MKKQKFLIIVLGSVFVLFGQGCVSHSNKTDAFKERAKKADSLLHERRRIYDSCLSEARAINYVDTNGKHQVLYIVPDIDTPRIEKLEKIADSLLQINADESGKVDPM